MSDNARLANVDTALAEELLRLCKKRWCEHPVLFGGSDYGARVCDTLFGVEMAFAMWVEERKRGVRA